jgi:hypothetical protein
MNPHKPNKLSAGISTATYRPTHIDAKTTNTQETYLAQETFVKGKRHNLKKSLGAIPAYIPDQLLLPGT